ncbi:GNAT family N-acetyltransferase [Microbacterium sp. TNHR37B]|uniref:GNAT family N-acetyltransferase n=1 Tax=Microbacterium sp. TNHR37B TaxID=1775956 RepID=UPI0007B1B63B|nr:GNAT family N-acetyltransferase [Microbacterium sp. TNHR37B]KZE88418.1 putative phosphinothricin acetyltransferase YwnH [Microbacterium sp. TNHR37B]
MTLAVRAMIAADWPYVEPIYREGILSGNATFESETPTWEHFDEGKLRVGRLVTIDPTGAVVGWIAASPVSTRPMYRGVVEHSLYVAASARGHGVGAALLDAFLSDVDAAGIWTVQSSIFPENAASIRLHERAGFRRVGHRERIAYMNHGPWAGTWRDTILVERRRR